MVEFGSVQGEMLGRADNPEKTVVRSASLEEGAACASLVDVEFPDRARSLAGDHGNHGLERGVEGGTELTVNSSVSHAVDSRLGEPGSVQADNIDEMSEDPLSVIVPLAFGAFLGATAPAGLLALSAGYSVVGELLLTPSLICLIAYGKSFFTKDESAEDGVSTVQSQIGEESSNDARANSLMLRGASWAVTGIASLVFMSSGHLAMGAATLALSLGIGLSIGQTIRAALTGEGD